MHTTITLNGIDHPCFTLGSGNPPHVSIIGYSSIAAVKRLMRELEHTQSLSGTVTGFPRGEHAVVHGALAVRRPRRRQEPQPIEPADAVLDLHGGDPVEALEPFALFHENAKDLALAFNLPYVVDSTGALEGSTSGAAAPAGTLGVIAEAGGIGQLDQHAVEMLVNGARNAPKHLNVLEGDPEPASSRIVGRFEWLYSTPGGFWVAAVKTGDTIKAGRLLGEVRDLYGDVQERVEAPEDGVVLFLTTSSAVKPNGLLLGLGCDQLAGAQPQAVAGEQRRQLVGVVGREPPGDPRAPEAGDRQRLGGRDPHPPQVSDEEALHHRLAVEPRKDVGVGDLACQLEGHVRQSAGTPRHGQPRRARTPPGRRNARYSECRSR